jgi:phosphohistidine swiveling domain-containing protein
VAERHGYHGPSEGEISSRVWREDPAPLQRMVAAYADKPDEEDPVKRDARARDRLPRLQAELVAALPAPQRPIVKPLLRHAARTIPLHSEYEALRLPASWRGTPVPEPLRPSADEDEAETIVTGVAASSGVVEGIVRVVTDPSFAEVEPGEILVSHTTDPSWAAIMFVSAALVVDIGGVISHAAVVARELGIPAVVNTRRGTDVLRDGDLVRVDGGAGTVEVLGRTSVRAA